MRINPKLPQVALSKSGDFESHEGDLIDEEQISTDPFCELWQSVDRLAVDYDPKFNALLAPLEVENPPNGFSECILGLNHEVMASRIV